VLSVVPRGTGVVSLGHGKVRKEENGRRRNERIIQRLRDILWKTSAKSSALRHKYDGSLRTCRRCNYLGDTTVGMGPLKMKDPPGGTTGRVKPYGRWGGWALAPNIATGVFGLPHYFCRRAAGKRSKRLLIFLTIWKR
jgi:hypothetical protein